LHFAFCTPYCIQQAILSRSSRSISVVGRAVKEFTRKTMFMSTARGLILTCFLLLSFCCPSSPFSTTTKTKTQSILSTNADIPPPLQSPAQQLAGDWSTAKLSLRNPKCCVVTVPGLELPLATLQEYFCGNDAPSDLDLRMRVRCGNENGDMNIVEKGVAYKDCAKIYNAVMEPSSTKDATKNNFDLDATNENKQNESTNTHPCILALEELARGVASLADGPLDGICTDVHMRVVCASNYQAIDPMFHTDKCPLRGYVTLTGPGTQYMDETCSPMEYAALRTLGVDGLLATGGKEKVQHLKMAQDLEFIVMKEDHYAAPLPNDIIPSASSMTQSIIGKVWDRNSSCVHRSPPSSSAVSSKKTGRRRVILSLDLADGKDDQEWYEAHRKRGWRSGMTQRKSHLVS